MSNIFKSSEFPLATSTLAQAFLAGQPNATQSAAYANALGGQTYAQGLAQQQALAKAREKEKKEKKSKRLGAIGSALGSIVAGPIGAVAGGVLGDQLGGGSNSVGDSLIQYGVPAATRGLGDYLVDNASIRTPGGTLTGDQIGEAGTPRSGQPAGYRIGRSLQRISGLDEEYQLRPNPDGSFTYYDPNLFKNYYSSYSYGG